MVSKGGRRLLNSPKWLLWVVGFWILIGLLALSQREQWAEGAAPPEIPYTMFKSLLAEGAVTAVTMEGEAATITLARPRPLGPDGAATERVSTRVPSFGDPTLLPTIEQNGVPMTVEDAEGGGLAAILVGFLPWLFLVGLYLFFVSRMYGNMSGLGGRGGLGDLLEGAATRETKAPARPVTFADVAGQENAKREVAELVDYMRNPARYQRLGAEVPRGVLLMGPPGTGKTLLAKALAGESGVPFFSISASEFIEVFVGVGAARVRKMFEEAKKRAPSIIFIDELDSIGRVRGTGFGGGHDEREQTLNQILAEMDGFSGHETVIVLAATNRPDVLDPALLRPGRFDRHVTLDLPDRDARQRILEVHTRKVPMADEVDLTLIASSTPGFSGADLKNLVNEAAMMAARENMDRVTRRHFEEMRDRVVIGSVRSMAIHPEERHRLAVHESGHTMVAHFLPKADPLHKVSIIPRGRALGVTQQLPEEERHTLPEDYLQDRLAVLLSGRCAERLVLGNVSSGADDDIKQASTLARAMVGRWGMSEEIGPVDLRDSEDHPFLGREIAQPRHFSDASAHAVDEAVRRLLLAAEERATAALAADRARLDALIAALEEHETLDRGEIDAILGDAEPAVASVARAG